MNRTLWKLGMGLVGGLIGTVMMQQMMKASGKLPYRLRPTQPKTDPGEFMIGKGEERVGLLRPAAHKAAVQGMHFGYGLVGPLALAAASRMMRFARREKPSCRARWWARWSGRLVTWAGCRRWGWCRLCIKCRSPRARRGCSDISPMARWPRCRWR